MSQGLWLALFASLLIHCLTASHFICPATNEYRPLTVLDAWPHDDFYESLLASWPNNIDDERRRQSHEITVNYQALRLLEDLYSRWCTSPFTLLLSYRDRRSSPLLYCRELATVYVG